MIAEPAPTSVRDIIQGKLDELLVERGPAFS